MKSKRVDFQAPEFLSNVSDFVNESFVRSSAVFCDCNTLFMRKGQVKNLYPNKGRFTAEQLAKAVMVKSAFSVGKRVEHMWSKVAEVQAENLLIKGILDNEPLEIVHLKLGETVIIPFKDVEDMWIEGKTPESVQILLKLKADANGHFL